jgi:uncharacterized glyoxalase superfamily protein PhnB
MDNAALKNRFIPCLAYQDAGKAIDWLNQAFGFEKKMVYQMDDGKIAHAELTYKGNMIMLGSSDSGSDWSKLIKHPDEIGGFESQSPYIIIESNEIDNHYLRAKEHGARILIDLKEEDYGGKNYTCSDPEGHIWSFGSYDPWEDHSS